MAKYSLVKLTPKFGNNAGVAMFYARAQVNETISIKRLAKLISMQTTVSYADALAVLASAGENMVLQLQMGNQVELGEIGKFRLQITSEGTKTADEFKSDVNITGVNIQYIPGEDLANVFTGMEFTQAPSRAVQKAALKAEKEGAKILNLEEVKKGSSKSDDSGTGGSTSGDNKEDQGSTSNPGGSDTGGGVE